ncbi:MazG-like family protein [Kitasatospora nipponensis]|uniref:MazG-like family protein n=1 Tax=Kitasatospora nipponensis TaxID=258049 RepID=A0ABN1WTN9_9ACTN
MNPTDWDTITRLVAWLDDHSSGDPEMGKVMRCLKIMEEGGEVAEALSGARSQNPRKGNSHTWEDVESELCDVIMTAMVALLTINPEGEKTWRRRLEAVAERSLSHT